MVTLEFNEGERINVFQHGLYFICAEVNFLALKQKKDLWEGYWAITKLMGRLKNQAPEGEGKHNHRPTAGMASVSCGLWHRRHSIPCATSHFPEATVSNFNWTLACSVPPSRFKVLGGCHLLTTFKSCGHVLAAERAGKMNIKVFHL